MLCGSYVVSSRSVNGDGDVLVICTLALRYDLINIDKVASQQPSIFST